MGRCESVTASLGIKILLPTLVEQMKSTNTKLIINMLMDGFIEEENEEFDNRWAAIVDSESVNENDCNATKTYLMEHIRSNDLSDKFLLFPIKEILTSSRWGYNREGSNGLSRKLDFDMTIDWSEYREIVSAEEVFIINQHAG